MASSGTRKDVWARRGFNERLQYSEDYEYTRNGTANVFLLLCPLLGWRHLEVTPRRGYHEFARLMKALVDEHFPKAEVA